MLTKRRLSQVVGVCLLIAGTAAAMEAGPRRRAARLVERTHLTETIVHYVYILRLGRADFDEIRVHRVVQTEGTGLPDTSEADGRRPDDKGKTNSIFLVHGASGSFTGAFLAGTLPSAETEEQSLAVYLAKHDIDVWGIDLAWSLVPFDTEDLSFLADWGLARQVEEVNAGLDFARWKRGNDGAMFLLGYSLGGSIGYAVLNDDATRSCGEQKVRGWIALDNGFKNTAPEAIQNACLAAQMNADLVESGVFREGTPELGRAIGTLALNDPNGPSPFAPGFTNRQFGLIVAALPQPGPPAANNPFYHFFAGILDPATSLPVDLAHVTPEFAFEWVSSLAGGTPTRLLADVNHVNCGNLDLPFDDFLGDVTVPVLYVGADGGFGDAGVSSTTFLGSTDVSVAIVDLVPGRLLDYGHLDIGAAPNARFLAWDTMIDWIEDHEGDACSE